MLVILAPEEYLRIYYILYKYVLFHNYSHSSIFFSQVKRVQRIMTDQQNKQPPKGWMHGSASPMRGNSARLMSPTPMTAPRQISPTPTFNARQMVDSSMPTFNPPYQPSTPPLRRLPTTPTGFTTIYESQRFSPSRPPAQQYQPPKASNVNQTKVPMSPVNFSSPTPSAPTPSSIPPFSPAPQYGYYEDDRQILTSSDFYVVPLEPVNLSKNFTVYDQDESRPSTADIIAQQSQDYVDEKLAEYQATISLLQGKYIENYYYYY